MRPSVEFFKYLQEIKKHFNSQEFLEVMTPQLVKSPGVEVHLHPVKVSGHEGFLGYLPTSPEIHLKKLLIQGFQKIYEIKQCFRDREMGDHHLLEFLMLEWYRVGAEIDEIETDTIQLIQTLSPQKILVERFSVQELFDIHLKFELQATTTVEELAELLKNRSDSFQAESFTDTFHYLFLHYIEPLLDTDKLTIVHSYPPSERALSELNGNGWSMRFEVYYKGMELANAYQELTEAKVYQKIFDEQNMQKQNLGFEKVVVDEEFLSLLNNPGLPKSAGIALGVERLFMALNGIDSIH